jgi:ribosomal protein S18 acetylase RimI-like enzyme
MTLQSLEKDPSAARSLARSAIRARRLQREDEESVVRSLERGVEGGRALGAIRLERDRPVGIAVWEGASPLGATLEVLFLEDGHRGPAEYGAFWDEVRTVAGPIAFAPGGLVGLTAREESELMRRRGFAPFARSEMQLPAASPLPRSDGGPEARARPARTGDRDALARLHERAYAGRFDRYLFLSDPDPGRDAEIVIRDVFEGRWGEFLPDASFVVEDGPGLGAACLVVRAPNGALIADVMVDPAVQGRGWGRAVLSTGVRALRADPGTTISLNVTEGNARAMRLYERLGFVRSTGPSSAWYSTERIPVAPDAG